jgi:hypothetical protein
MTGTRACFLFAVLALSCFECPTATPSIEELPSRAVAAVIRTAAPSAICGSTALLERDVQAGGRKPTNGSPGTAFAAPKWLSGPMSRCHAVDLPHPWRSSKSSDQKLAVRGRGKHERIALRFNSLLRWGILSPCCLLLLLLRPAAPAICLGRGTRPVRWIFSRFCPVDRIALTVIG